MKNCGYFAAKIMVKIMSKYSKFDGARTIQKIIVKKSLRVPNSITFVLIQNFLGFQMVPKA